MIVSCSNCATKFNVPDAKVAGKRARMRCKKCGTAIAIDGTNLGSQLSSPRPHTPPSRPGGSYSHHSAPINELPQNRSDISPRWRLADPLGRRIETTLDQLAEFYKAGQLTEGTLICAPGKTAWLAPSQYPELLRKAGQNVPPPRPPMPTFTDETVALGRAETEVLKSQSRNLPAQGQARPRVEDTQPGDEGLFNATDLNDAMSSFDNLTSSRPAPPVPAQAPMPPVPVNPPPEPMTGPLVPRGVAAAPPQQARVARPMRIGASTAIGVAPPAPGSFPMAQAEQLALSAGVQPPPLAAPSLGNTPPPLGSPPPPMRSAPPALGSAPPPPPQREAAFAGVAATNAPTSSVPPPFQRPATASTAPAQAASPIGSSPSAASNGGDAHLAPSPAGSSPLAAPAPTAPRSSTHPSAPSTPPISSPSASLPQRPPGWDMDVSAAHSRVGPPPKSKGNSGLWLFLIVALVAMGGGGVYRFKPAWIATARSSVRGAVAKLRPAPTPAPETTGPEFDTKIAGQALGETARRASQCKEALGPMGKGRARVLFEPSGKALEVAVSEPFHQTNVGKCVIQLFMTTRVPAFGGQAVIVNKTFEIK